MSSRIPLNGFWALLPKSEYETIVEARDAALQKAETLSGQVQELTDENKTLKTRLEEATKPSAPAVPRILGFTIENSKVSPSGTQYAKVRKAMDWGKKQGLNLYRIYLNPGEMTNHARPPKGYTLGNLIAYGRSLGLRYVADTMDTILRQLPDRVRLKQYCDDAISQGCEGFYINDADQYPILDLWGMVERLRDVAPDVPIYVSLMGNAKVALYQRLVDRVEIQAFGSDAELKMYLSLKTKPIPCLDLRKELTVDDLKRKAVIIAQASPRDVFFYADWPDDYDAMPDDEDAVIRDLITTLKTSI